MFANRRLMGVFVLAAAAVGGIAAAPAQAGNSHCGSGRVVVYSNDCAPRASVYVSVERRARHYSGRDRYEDRRRGHNRQWRDDRCDDRRSYRRGRC